MCIRDRHYTNFKERFQNFAVNIDVLSRFRSKKEQAETLEKLKNGQVDILIGTHRVLSKDVVFSDLGLMIIDEEQRFGVKPVSYTHLDVYKRQGDGNVWAVSAALAVSEDLALTYNPLFIYGGPGLGKTHLLNAIGNEILKNIPDAVSYTHLDVYKRQELEFLETASVSSFFCSSVRD